MLRNIDFIPSRKLYSFLRDTRRLEKSYWRLLLYLEFPKFYSLQWWKRYCNASCYEIWLFLFQLERYYSIALMAVCESHYRVILVNIMEGWRSSDGGISANSHFGNAFDGKTLSLPKLFFDQTQDLIFPTFLVDTRCSLLNIIWCGHIQKQC